MSRVFHDQHEAREGDWVKWMRHGMPKAIRSQVYVNSRGNYCVGGYPFRKAQPVIGVSALPMFDLFEIAKRKATR